MSKKKIQLNETPPEQTPSSLPGGMPLPIGKPISVNPASLTEKERRDLEAIGWRPGMPIPSNLADLIEKVAKEATDPNLMPPPTDPSTPPLKVPQPVDLESLPEEKKEELRKALQQAASAPTSSSQPPMPQQPGEGVVEAIQAARGIGGKEIQIENDLPEKPQQAASPPPPPPPVEEAAPPPAENYSTTESAPQHSGTCPHCGWDLEVRDTVEVTEEDKNSFVAAMLGEKPFQKVYSLLGGRLQVTLRSLYAYEVDACYAQCYADRKAGKIVTATDFMEDLHRYQLSLQLVELRSEQDLVQFPESLDDWGDRNTEGLLVKVREKVYGEALRTESLTRVISGVLTDFRRLLAKLEANADRPDFYRAAEPAL